MFCTSSAYYFSTRVSNSPFIWHKFLGISYSKDSHTFLLFATTRNLTISVNTDRLIFSVFKFKKKKLKFERLGVRYMCDVEVLTQTYTVPLKKLWYFFYFNITCFDRCRWSGVLYKQSKWRRNMIWEISQVLKALYCNETVILIFHITFTILSSLYTLPSGPTWPVLGWKLLLFFICSAELRLSKWLGLCFIT
jgi:hypothetical protein